MAARSAMESSVLEVASALLEEGADADQVREDTMRNVVSAWAESHQQELPKALRLLPSVERHDTLVDAFAKEPVEAVGGAYELLVAHSVKDGRWVRTRARKQSGSFYTPPAVAARVAREALTPRAAEIAALPESERRAAWLATRVCDPAAGAGVFLLAALGVIAAESGAPTAAVARSCLFGVDKSALAVAVAEASVALAAGAVPRLAVGDALVGAPPGPARTLFPTGGFDWRAAFPDAADGFHVVIGNPPWIAYAGRAAQPLAPELRAYFREHYRTLRGYPTLHGLFVERAAALAPRGTIALIVPSPLSDLDGYRPVRHVLAESHTPREPLLELGQDAFVGVTQPCIVLIADPGADPRGGDRAWRLVERQRSAAQAAEVSVPAALSRLAERAPLPAELFGEMGFQSSGEVSRRLFRRADAPDALHDYPLLEGRNVHEFRQDAPRLYLHRDADVLARSRCRVRPLDDYRRARFVIRQTAAWPIAALHGGLPFRNSLLAGFAHDAFAPELVVALLNSALYRALHLAARRDARQAAFPQMKVAHLRALPAPPSDPERHARLSDLCRRATASGIDTALRRELDAVVFDLFDIGDARNEILTFLAARAPKLAKL
ncbi:MAG: N-6 DNA methylase [Polyangiaceae bacterium]|nr:N-6 DNA methylase [Polyangiaceae bacterium]